MKNKILKYTISSLILFVAFSNIISAGSNWFSDVPTYHKYFNSIKRIVDLKIMSGDNGEFNPEQPVTRAELADALSKIIDNVDYEQKIINTIANSLPLVVKIIGSTVTTFPAEDGKPLRWMADPIVSMGSGVFVDENLILTNAHVVSDRNQYQIETFDGEKYWAELIKSDTILDLALLKLKTDKTFKFIHFADKIERGQTSLIIGHTTADSGDTELAWGVTKGVVSNPNANVSWFNNRLQIDNPINAGNSGAPVININGEMMGLVVSSATKNEDIGFAIRLDDIREFISDYGSE